MLAAFNLMYPYFTEEEVNRFRNICLSHQIPPNRALFSSKLDVLWFPFLKRLNKLDPTVSLNPPCSGDVGAWRYQRFVLGYEKIGETQEENIAYLREHHKDLAQIFLYSLKLDGLSLLQQLEKRHDAIQRMRTALLMEKDKEDAQTGVFLQDDTKTLLNQMPLMTQPIAPMNFPLLPELEAMDCDVVEELNNLKL